jgi:hypothetical protein
MQCTCDFKLALKIQVAEPCVTAFRSNTMLQRCKYILVASACTLTC